MTEGKSDSELLGLIQQARRGDEAALGEILDGQRDWLRAVARKELDGKIASRIDASDIVQQTLLSAFNRFQQFEGRSQGEFIAWLRKIQEHNIQDAMRRHLDSHQRGTDREDVHVDLGDIATNDVSTPSGLAMRMEQVASLRQVLEVLPEDQREAVRLRHLEGWSLVQLANHFGRSKSAIASLLKRGIEHLRNHIRDD
ncbi:sigma-70 family RNA polymerase sigma factor [bacterium]|nr:sigma-70 family RNA polymerase sigma factor [bacterium]